MNTVRKPLTTLALALALTAPALAAQSHADHDHSTPDGMAQHMQMMQMPASGAAAQEAQANGEVRKIDPASGKITLRHGPIPSLGMGAMTMNYRLADPKLIDGLKVGDKVRFTVQQQDGTDVVTRIDRVQ